MGVVGGRAYHQLLDTVGIRQGQQDRSDPVGAGGHPVGPLLGQQLHVQSLNGYTSACSTDNRAPAWAPSGRRCQTSWLVTRRTTSVSVSAHTTDTATLATATGQSFEGWNCRR
jgi:hypothetical protein